MKLSLKSFQARPFHEHLLRRALLTELYSLILLITVPSNVHRSILTFTVQLWVQRLHFLILVVNHDLSLPEQENQEVCLILLLFWYKASSIFITCLSARSCCQKCHISSSCPGEHFPDNTKGSPCPPTGTTCELCPPGWQLHRGRCYFFSEEAKSWEDSWKNCLARKSQLLVIEDEIEMVSLAAALKACDSPQPNISPRENGLDVKSTSLKSIEADKNCAVYRRKNMIQADNCQTLKEWICKKNATLLVL
uniref:C-type lectin domain-containing protein n=1 Tax=Zosterops lateralis melanops TaxID=1220523 RepID=A0A8D2PA35_ZOSLA